VGRCSLVLSCCYGNVHAVGEREEVLETGNSYIGGGRGISHSDGFDVFSKSKILYVLYFNAPSVLRPFHISLQTLFYLSLYLYFTLNQNVTRYSLCYAVGIVYFGINYKQYLFYILYNFNINNLNKKEKMDICLETNGLHHGDV
jgi:hypothetical protein